MLNLVAFDPEYDRELLESSYESILNKDLLTIITDAGEQAVLLKKIQNNMVIPGEASIRFQNLFKFNLPKGQFYLAQCLLNFGFSASSRTHSFQEHHYHFQIIGIAAIRFDLGKTFMRPETKIDKITGRFFGNDIDLPETKKFNDKYYLVSDNPDPVFTHFDKQFANTISKHDNVLLFIKNKEMVVTFDTDIEEEHSGIVEDILLNCNFLTT